MKFLVDAQLPNALSDLLKQKGFDCIHTSDLPQKNLTPDSSIINISKKEERIVITKDSDFYHSFILKREPHKVLFVRVGNLKLSKLLKLFDANLESIVNKFKSGNMVEITSEDIRILY